MSEPSPYPFSSRARVVLAIARAIAAGRGEDDLIPMHVALGLLREGENAAVAVLQHLGVEPGPMRRDLERLLGRPPGGTQPELVALPLTPGEQRVIEQARSWSCSEGDEYIGPEHLLLALLSDGKSPVAEALARHGIGIESARPSLRIVIHKHPHSPPSDAPPRAV